MFVMCVRVDLCSSTQFAPVAPHAVQMSPPAVIRAVHNRSDAVPAHDEDWRAYNAQFYMEKVRLQAELCTVVSPLY
jgi:hypothetical protein